MWYFAFTRCLCAIPITDGPPFDGLAWDGTDVEKDARTSGKRELDDSAEQLVRDNIAGKRNGGKREERVKGRSEEKTMSAWAEDVCGVYWVVDVGGREKSGVS